MPLGGRRIVFRETDMAHLVPDHDETAGVDVGQWTNQYRIDGAEDGAVATDAEREREHGHGGETGVLQQLAEGEAKIVHRSLSEVSCRRSEVSQSSKSQVPSSK